MSSGPISDDLTQQTSFFFMLPSVVQLEGKETASALESFKGFFRDTADAVNGSL